MIAALTGVPAPSILDDSLFMQQVLNGNYNIQLFRPIADIISRRGNNRPNNRSQNTGNGSNNQAPVYSHPIFEAAINTNQLPQLKVSGQSYSQGVAPALASKQVSIPTHNGQQECARWLLKGSCNKKCPRASNHTTVAANSDRYNAVLQFKNNCKNWHSRNRQAGDSDFH